MFEYFKGKKLYRTPNDGLVAGIAAGLARFLRVDAVFVRLALIVLGALFGWTRLVLVYALAFVIIPVDPSQDTVDATQEPKDVTHAQADEKMDSSQNM